MPKDYPLLGLATTKQLLAELEARFRIHGPMRAAHYIDLASQQCTQDQLNYRTVDS